MCRKMQFNVFHNNNSLMLDAGYLPLLGISTSTEDNSRLNPSEEPIQWTNRDSVEVCVKMMIPSKEV